MTTHTSQVSVLWLCVLACFLGGDREQFYYLLSYRSCSWVISNFWWLTMTYDPLGIDYMCPFCVAPWKCNGPHIEVDDMAEFQEYVDNKWDEAIGQAIEQVYKDCHHTKYEGCQPCPHDEIAHRIGELETRRGILRKMTQEAQEIGLYETTLNQFPETD